MLTEKLKSACESPYLKRFVAAHYSLLSWLEVRPLLRPGDCEYSQQLINEMLYCHDKMVENHFIPYDYDTVEHLIKMLEDLLPNSDPPIARVSFLLKNQPIMLKSFHTKPRGDSSVLVQALLAPAALGVNMQASFHISPRLRV